MFFVCYYQYGPYAIFIVCIVNDLIFNEKKKNASNFLIIATPYNQHFQMILVSFIRLNNHAPNPSAITNNLHKSGCVVVYHWPS